MGAAPFGRESATVVSGSSYAAERHDLVDARDLVAEHEVDTRQHDECHGQDRRDADGVVEVEVEHEPTTLPTHTERAGPALHARPVPDVEPAHEHDQPSHPEPGDGVRGFDAEDRRAVQVHVQVEQVLHEHGRVMVVGGHAPGPRVDEDDVRLAVGRGGADLVAGGVVGSRCEHVADRLARPGVAGGGDGAVRADVALGRLEVAAVPPAVDLVIEHEHRARDALQQDPGQERERRASGAASRPHRAGRRARGAAGSAAPRECRRPPPAWPPAAQQWESARPWVRAT